VAIAIPSQGMQYAPSNRYFRRGGPFAMALSIAVPLSVVTTLVVKYIYGEQHGISAYLAVAICSWMLASIPSIVVANASFFLKRRYALRVTRNMLFAAAPGCLIIGLPIFLDTITSLL